MGIYDRELVAGLKPRPGATADQLSNLAEFIGATVPDDYVSFLAGSNGAEGAVGSGYVQLWSTSDVAALNRAYEVSEFAPGLILFGTDGGDTGYGFDMRTESGPTIVQVPLLGMSWSASEKIADSFSSFVHGLQA